MFNLKTFIITSHISKINNTFTDNKEYLDIVMSMHNLLQYSENSSVLSGSLGNYYWDEMDYDGGDICNTK